MLHSRIQTICGRDDADRKYNMFDIYGVQREAYELGHFELVVFIQEHKENYIKFIMTGER